MDDPSMPATLPWFVLTCLWPEGGRSKKVANSTAVPSSGPCCAALVVAVVVVTWCGQLCSGRHSSAGGSQERPCCEDRPPVPCCVPCMQEYGPVALMEEITALRLHSSIAEGDITWMDPRTHTTRMSM